MSEKKAVRICSKRSSYNVLSNLVGGQKCSELLSRVTPEKGWVMFTLATYILSATQLANHGWVWLWMSNFWCWTILPIQHLEGAEETVSNVFANLVNISDWRSQPQMPCAFHEKHASTDLGHQSITKCLCNGNLMDYNLKWENQPR